MSQFTINKELRRVNIGGLLEYSVLTPGTTYSCPDELYSKLSEIVGNTKGFALTKVSDDKGNVVTGSKSSGAALTSLLSTLATAGIIVNSTSA